MNDHATKPIEPQKLFATLIKWIKPGVREVLVLRQEKSNEEEEENLPECLPGIDIKSALVRFDGDKGLFRKVMLMFQDQQKNATKEILEAIEESNMVVAERLAHTTKGLAGNVGAMELFDSADKLESAIEKRTGEDLAPLLNNFEERFNQVMESINLLRETTSTENQAEKEITEPDLEKVKPILVKLADLIEANSVEVEDYLESLKKHMKGSKFREELKKFEESIDAFDFENAKIILAEIRQSPEFCNERKNR